MSKEIPIDAKLASVASVSRVTPERSERASLTSIRALAERRLVFDVVLKTGSIPILMKDALMLAFSQL